MKTMRKALTLLLVLAMVLSLSITAAATPTGGSSEADAQITVINPSKTISIAECTVNVYKIFDLTYDAAGNKGDGAYVYTPVEELETYTYNDGTTDVTKANILEYIQDLSNDQKKMQKFAADMQTKAVELGLPTASETVPAMTEQVTIDVHELGIGYYLVTVTPKAAGNGNQNGVTPAISVSLDTTDYQPTVYVKADAPVLDKTAKDLDKSGDSYTDAARPVQVGSKLSYQLTSKVPNYNGYTSYKFKISDDLSDGLTRVDDISITVGGNTCPATLYKVTNGAPDTDDFTITFGDNQGKDDMVAFVNAWNNLDDHASKKIAIGSEIIVTYNAIVNSDALTTGEETNTAKLTYSNNPTSDGTGDTPKEIIHHYDFKINLKKVDGTEGANDKALGGAVFALKNTNADPAAYQNKYYKYTDKAHSKQATSATNTGKVTWVDAAASSTLLISDADGNLYPAKADSNGKYIKTPESAATTFKGLTAGTYELEEIQAPEGYNKLKGNIEVKIVPNLAPDGKTVTSVKYIFTDKATDSIQTGATSEGVTVNTQPVDAGNTALVIKNLTGTELPSTGGIGTTIFYVVGGLMMVTALVLLITKKRMAA